MGIRGRHRTSIFVCIGVHSWLFAASALSATVEVGWVRTTEGQRVTVPIVVQAGTNALGRYDFEVSLGTNVLQFVSAQGGCAEFDSPLANDQGGGAIRLSDQNLTSLDAPTGRVEVVRLTCDVIGEAGSTGRVDLAEAQLFDTAGRPLGADAAGGGVVVVTRAQVSAGSADAGEGMEFTLPIEIDCKASVLGRYEVEVQYDPALAQLSGVQGGCGFCPSPVVNTNEAGRLILCDQNLSSLSQPTGLVQAATLQFRAVGAYGTGSVQVARSTVYDADASELVSTNAPGRFTIDLDSDNDGMPDWWEKDKFADALLALAGEDEDRDTIKNLLEYGSGGDPHQRDGGRAYARREISDGGRRYLALEYRRLKAADHLQFQVYVSEDLVNWQAGEGRTTVVSVVDKGDGTEAIIERDNVPLGDVPRRFLKLVVGRRQN